MVFVLMCQRGQVRARDALPRQDRLHSVRDSGRPLQVLSRLDPRRSHLQRQWTRLQRLRRRRPAGLGAHVQHRHLRLRGTVIPPYSLITLIALPRGNTIANLISTFVSALKTE